MRKNLIKYVLPVIAVIVGVLWYLLSCEVEQGVFHDETVFEFKQEEAVYAGSEAVADVKDPVTTSLNLIAVHVCGAVVSPGVYLIEDGARVVQAIEAAGGVCDDAMQDYLNLAETVKDGGKIYVPTKEEVLTGDVQAGTDNTAAGETVLCVNINTATKSELMQLPGIGESKADSIIAYREEHGYFKSAEDIMLINGIKEAVYSRIKDYIKVKN